MSFFQELLKRRVPQICGIYLGAIFAGVEFTDIIVERYGLSDRLVDGVLIGMLACLPTVIMVAWFHGAPGRDRWRRREMVGIPVNLIAAAVLVAVLSPESPVQAASETRSTVDENGQTITVEVPNVDLVERVAVFFLDPEGFEETSPWQSYAISLLIEGGLSSDKYVSTYSLYQGYSRGNVWKLKRSGHTNALNAPLSLLDEVALGWHQDYFVTGSLSPLADDRWKAKVRLYETGSKKLLMEVELEADTLFALSNAATESIVEKLQRPSDSKTLVSRLPAEELFSKNLAALELYVKGKNALLLSSDAAQAISLWKQVVELDSGFAPVYLDLAGVYDNMGENDLALANLKELNRLAHKLDDEKRIRIKAWTYELRNEPDKSTKVYEMWTSLYEDDHDAWMSLGYSYLFNGNRIDDAIAAFEKSLDLMPNQHWLQNQLGQLHRVRGEYDKAISRFERYHELLPQNYLALVAIGDIKTVQGDLSSAETYYRQGQLAQTEMITPVIRLAENQIRRGNVEEAMALLEEAEFVAEAPRQVSGLAGAKFRLLATLGRPAEALAYLKQQYEIDAQTMSIFDVDIAHMRAMQVYELAGKGAEADALMEQIAPRYKPPYDFMPSIGYMVLNMSRGEWEEADFHTKKISQALRQAGRDDLVFVTEFTQGIILRGQGDLEGAIEKLELAGDLFEASSQVAAGDSDVEHEQIRLELAATYLRLDRPDSALTALESLLLEWPFHPYGNWLAAQAYQAQGSVEEANRRLEMARTMWANAEPLFEPAQQAAAGFPEGAE